MTTSGDEWNIWLQRPTLSELNKRVLGWESFIYEYEHHFYDVGPNLINLLLNLRDRVIKISFRKKNYSGCQLEPYYE